MNMKKLLLCGLVMLTSACGSGLSGTYTDPSGVLSLTFESGGKVLVSDLGVQMEQSYQVEDGKVKVTSPQGTLVFTRLADGSIQGPMDIKLTRQKK